MHSGPLGATTQAAVRWRGRLLSGCLVGKPVEQLCRLGDRDQIGRLALGRAFERRDSHATQQVGLRAVHRVRPPPGVWRGERLRAGGANVVLSDPVHVLRFMDYLPGGSQ